MRKGQRILLAWLFTGTLSVSVQGETPVPASGGRFAAAMEQLLWRPGGPDVSGMKSLLERAAVTGSYENVANVEGEISRLVKAGAIDGREFLPCVPAMERAGSARSDAGSELRGAVELSNRSSNDRERIASNDLAKASADDERPGRHKDGDHLDLAWTMAASDLLWVGDRHSVEAVASTLDGRAARGSLTHLEKRVKGVDLRIALARVSAEPVRGYLDLVRQGMLAGDEDGLTELDRSILVRESLLSLFRDGRYRSSEGKLIVSELESIWKALQARERELGRAGRGLGPYRSAGPLPFHEFYATQYLIGAIRSFSGTDFEKAWWESCFIESPGKIMASLGSPKAQ